MSTASFTKPQIICCEYENRSLPRMAEMLLDWNDCNGEIQEEIWKLPTGVVLNGAAPTRFGIQIHRWDADEYAMTLLWNETQFGWRSLTRSQVMDSCLGMILEALETDLEYLLDQPVQSIDT